MKAYATLAIAAGLALSHISTVVVDDARTARVEFKAGGSSAVVTDRTAARRQDGPLGLHRIPCATALANSTRIHPL